MISDVFEVEYFERVAKIVVVEVTWDTISEAASKEEIQLFWKLMVL